MDGNQDDKAVLTITKVVTLKLKEVTIFYGNLSLSSS